MPQTILKHISAAAVAETKNKSKALNEFSMGLQSLQKALIFSFGQTGNDSPKSLFTIAFTVLFMERVHQNTRN